MPLATWKDLCFDAQDPAAAARFWGPVCGLEPNISERAVFLDGPTPHHRIWINQVDRPRTVKNRIHPDVDAASVSDVVALGAAVHRSQEEIGHGWAWLTGPEGDDLCVFPRGEGTVPAYRLHGLGIDSVDPRAQALWWGEVLGAEPEIDEEYDVHTLTGVAVDGRMTLDFVSVPEPRVGPNRVHWDLFGEVQPLLEHGATRLWDMEHWTVLADPEGNEFCVFAPE